MFAKTCAFTHNNDIYLSNELWITDGNDFTVLRSILFRYRMSREASNAKITTVTKFEVHVVSTWRRRGTLLTSSRSETQHARLEANANRCCHRRRDGDRPWRHVIVIGPRLPGTPRHKDESDEFLERSVCDSSFAVYTWANMPARARYISSLMPSSREVAKLARTRSNKKEQLDFP